MHVLHVANKSRENPGINRAMVTGEGHLAAYSGGYKSDSRCRVLQDERQVKDTTPITCPSLIHEGIIEGGARGIIQYS